MRVKKLLMQLKDYSMRSYITATFSLAVNIAFLAYNLFLGVVYQSVWNASMCGYYFILIMLRGMIFYNEKKWHEMPPSNLFKRRIRLFRLLSWMLFILDIALIAPIALMVKSERVVNIGMIPAITIAAYTTYKIVMAILNYKKTRRQQNLSLYGLKIINLKDALVSILTLQNTMIMVFGDEVSMMKLGAYTSAVILGIMMLITILLIKKARVYTFSSDSSDYFDF